MQKCAQATAAAVNAYSQVIEKETKRNERAREGEIIMRLSLGIQYQPFESAHGAIHIFHEINSKLTHFNCPIEIEHRISRCVRPVNYFGRARVGYSLWC